MGRLSPDLKGDSAVQEMRMTKTIGRRQILGGLATGTAALGLSVKALAYATGKRRLKMVTTWAKNFSAWHGT